jgi:hypothetical protein
MHFTNRTEKRRTTFSRSPFEGKSPRPPVVGKPPRRFPPADWGRYVTIGIAAKSNDNECIVTATDRRWSFDDQVPSVDSGVNKQWFVGNNWVALCAANDPCFLLPIISKANALLKERGGKESANDVRLAMCDAYREVRDEYTSSQYLGLWGFRDWDHFRAEKAGIKDKKGRWFHESLEAKIENDGFGETTFLVCGYEDSADGTRCAIPRMFEIKNPGASFLLDHAPYFVVGSGSAIAMASLNMKPISHLNPAQLIYRVLEAKFAAESSSAVGTSTLVLIANRGEPMTFLSFGTIERIRKLWEASRMAPPPDEINQLIIETPPRAVRVLA